MDNAGKNNSQGKWARYLMVSYTIRRASYIIRALAGLYLVYLMYQLFSDSGKSGEELTVFMMAVGAFMMAAGIYFAIGGGYALLNGIYAENQLADESESVEETASADAVEAAPIPETLEASPEADSENDALGNETET